MAASKEDQRELDRIAKICVNIAYVIHKKLGPGLLESAYLRIFLHELRKAGLKAATEVAVPLIWDGEDMGTAYRADLIVEGKLVIELKAVDNHPKLFARQLQTYLKLLDYRLGLVISFGLETIAKGTERVANNF
ncbi:MAG: GxxExxY protein [Planctomycetes bacterium]|nr:GxxExxY protein [Planctomycetota bacterium]